MHLHASFCFFIILVLFEIQHLQLRYEDQTEFYT